MKLLGSTKSKITEDGRQHDSGVLYKFLPDNLFDQLLYPSPNFFLFLKTFLKTLIRSFLILKYGLLIKILNR